jgi:hypothetical protein
MVPGATAAHALAYHFAPNQPFGFALYADSYAQDSNYDQVIVGNMYAYRSVQPQSNGQSATCLQNGALVLGDPQAPHPLPSPDPAAGQVQQANLTHGAQVTFLGDCSSAGGGEVAQTAVAGPAIPPPDLPAPSLDPNAQTYGCNGNHGLIGGLPAGHLRLRPDRRPPAEPGRVRDHPQPRARQRRDHQPGGLGDLHRRRHRQLRRLLYGVTFYLQQGSGTGASMYVGKGGGLQVRLTPYAPTGSSNPGDGHYPHLRAARVTASLSVDKVKTLLSTQGTVYIPSGSRRRRRSPCTRSRPAARRRRDRRARNSRSRSWSPRSSRSSSWSERRATGWSSTAEVVVISE